jgi:predicted CoA-substrate-specific enzyme activase
MAVIGLDIGSRTVKLVFLERGTITRFLIMDGGVNPLGKVLQALQGERWEKVVSTGYGRHLARESLADQTITEIKAFALGAHYFYPTARMVIDVGGQDTKVIVLSTTGALEQFEINDRCAAGTGKFLEVMAHTFELTPEQFGNFAISSTTSTKINSMCTVFAESEVISLIARGQNPQGIALGLHQAVVDRIYTMVCRVNMKQPIVFAGGGALNPCLGKLIEQKLGISLIMPENPQILGALGAALYASEKVHS